MAKFKVPIWWYELHGSTVEIEADSLEEAVEIADMNTKELVYKAREESGDTFSGDGDMGHDEVTEVKEE